MSGLRPWPRDPRFQVSEGGDIYGPSGRSIGVRRQDGRKQIAILDNGKVRTHLASHIVCETFHGPRPEGMEAAHDNGDPSDDRAVNLAWKTHKENEADKVRHGTLRRGEESTRAKLNDAAVIDIRNRARNGEPLQSIADRYGVSKSTISRAATGRHWGHLI